MIFLDNLTKVRQAVESCGRKVALVAACKTQTRQTVDEFMSVAPEFALGENRVQELVDKYDQRYEWHFIGRLQTNKVKYIIDKVSLIHSLDRYALADEIERQAAKIDRIQPCLVEVNMGGEESKGGIEPSQTLDFIRGLEAYRHIEVRGLMSVMPKTEDKEALCALYDRLYGLFLQTKELSQHNVAIEYLSAGMSSDFETALAHGANMIRLGRLLFGERDYAVR